jgi:hypothetical protein
MATCFKSKQEGAEDGQCFVGVKMSGEFAHMHSVRKFIAS